MGDVAKVLLAISRGDFDTQLGDIAQGLAQRQADLEAQQLAAAVLLAYAERTGTSAAEIIESLEE